MISLRFPFKLVKPDAIDQPEANQICIRPSSKYFLGTHRTRGNWSITRARILPEEGEGGSPVILHLQLSLTGVTEGMIYHIRTQPPSAEHRHPFSKYTLGTHRTHAT